MAKTLVVKLAGTVDNDDLRKLGVISIKIVPVSTLPANWQYEVTGDTQQIRLATSRPIKLELTGDGHFTDYYLTQDLGKTIMTAGTGELQIFHVSDSTSILDIHDKYAVTKFYLWMSGRHFAWTVNVNDFAGMDEATEIWAHYVNYSPECSLDVFRGTTKLSVFGLVYNGVTKIRGDLSVLEGNTGMTSINLNNQALITGNISSLAGMTELTNVDFNGIAGITGNTSSIAHLHPNNGGHLADFRYINSGITGEWPPSA